jgi:hypothetical protein
VVPALDFRWDRSEGFFEAWTELEVNRVNVSVGCRRDILVVMRKGKLMYSINKELPYAKEMYNRKAENDSG